MKKENGVRELEMFWSSIFKVSLQNFQIEKLKIIWDSKNEFFLDYFSAE